ncbi:PorT family protein [Flavobacterium sp. AC]|uniref:PorT family protein n=2 Tax=Flavobacteriaceae TaxID=49546 RepID=A0ABT4WGJ4_9FLAO|nr:porin family protein [Flavobacterium azizsancarii]MDA6071671.1 PorT family protein [Flavobacterium azizsancarii]
MRLLFSCLFLVSFFNSFAQEVKPEIKPIVKIDSLYREDQFYFSVTYNLLLNGPTGLKQNKFSAGVSAGFLRDMPINKDRTIAIAAGFGLSYQNFYQNFTVSKSADGTNVYNVSSYSDIGSNRYKQYSVDVPIEFRWRNSTYESYKFWRIYSGVKMSYIFSDKSILKDGDASYKVSNNKDINQFQYGVYVSAGYNTWNVYCYYGLNGLFDKSVKTVSGENVQMSAMNIGLIFYIL